ncbi:Acetyltransferase [Alloactinosynnema sp. L-07]|uniref:GNAT family N-acetyltransferase n=1 Tax=Alloactinosynnema sp. L-07 TaxID=1653480 RepID=UPI00065F0419|nr:GNAT family protein [Alloactinosynnema sp. L-07]CRK59879.1 Acetyltransferase [Alloactinosynnema sp. L-07]
MSRPELPIKTRRLVLRQFSMDDLDALHAIQSREDVAKYLYWEPRTREETEEALHVYLTSTSLAKEGDGLRLAVTLADTGELIGDVMLLWTSEQHQGGEIGYTLHPDHGGKGYAGEAAVEMLKVGFDELGLHRVIGRLDADNRASGRLLERLGMRFEARFKQNEFVKGRWADEAVYAMLADEWRELTES